MLIITVGSIMITLLLGILGCIYQEKKEYKPY